MRDYWLSKMFFDLQQPALAAEFKADRESVFKKYPLDERVKKALLEDDAPFLAERTNAYLLRYYFFATGMKDAEFIRKLRGG
jgi:hypothetical protein